MGLNEVIRCNGCAIGCPVAQHSCLMMDREHAWTYYRDEVIKRINFVAVKKTAESFWESPGNHTCWVTKTPVEKCLFDVPGASTRGKTSIEQELYALVFRKILKSFLYETKGNKVGIWFDFSLCVRWYHFFVLLPNATCATSVTWWKSRVSRIKLSRTFSL